VLPLIMSTQQTSQEIRRLLHKLGHNLKHVLEDEILGRMITQLSRIVPPLGEAGVDAGSQGQTAATAWRHARHAGPGLQPGQPVLTFRLAAGPGRPHVLPGAWCAHIAEVGLSTCADRPVGVIGLTTQAQLLRPQVTLGGAVWTPAPNRPPEVTSLAGLLWNIVCRASSPSLGSVLESQGLFPAQVVLHIREVAVWPG